MNKIFLKYENIGARYWGIVAKNYPNQDLPWCGYFNYYDEEEYDQLNLQHIKFKQRMEKRYGLFSK